jgi:hypothetical protein
MTSGKWAYWISTGLLCALYLAAAGFYLTQRPMVETIYGTLGYPTYLISLLIVVKILGPAAILSRVSVPLSDLAYAGMFYHLLLAFSAHVAAHDPGFVPAVVMFALLLVSFFTQNAARKGASPYAGTRFGSAA